MKNMFAFLFSRGNLFIIALFAGYVCSSSRQIEQSVFAPVYMTYTELRNAIALQPARDVSQVGKIYLFNNYLFVNEINKGVHVMDTTNPAAPVNKGFINIPGNVDIAIKNNTLYADSFVDLVALDITNLTANLTANTAPPEVARLQNLFPYPYNFADNFMTGSGRYEAIDETMGIVINWAYAYSEQISDNNNFGCAQQSSMDVAVMANTTSGSSGTGGSLARFIITPDLLYLYALNNTSINIINISTETNPVLSSVLYAGWNIETLFIYNSTTLFIGSQTGLYIYDITNSAAPVQQSLFTHFRGCDPVVVANNYAFVTINNNFGPCGGNVNELQIINVTNLYAPALVSTLTMNDPHGLAFDTTQNLLFICDGINGLLVYNTWFTTSGVNLGLADIYSPMNPHDLILFNKIAYVVAADGIYIFNYSNFATTGTLGIPAFLPIIPSL